MENMTAGTLTLGSIQWDLIIGGLALFLFGIQYMGDGLKSIAGDKLRDYIDKYTNKPWKGILVGTIITVFIQSSSATSAIAIGFVRAGLMKVDQSIGIIIGANIGTTITAFLIGLKVEDLALYFVFLGVLITLFSKRKKQAYVGQIVLGFGLLFFGLKLMGDELSTLGQLDLFEDLATTMAHQPILGLIVGTIITGIVQSSSATVGIIQKIYDSGAMTLYAALPFVFGSSIGTTITGVFASIGGSIASKRAAAINVLFNVLGAVLFMLLLTPYTGFIENLTRQFNLTPMMQIAFAHIIRAVIISILAYPFINVFVKVSKKIIPGESSERIEINFNGLDSKLASSLPAGALGVSKQAIVKMADLSIEAIKDTQKFFNTKSGKYKDSARQLEDAINTLDTKITEYLTNIAHESLGEHDIDEYLGYLQVVKNIERIGDLAMNLNEFYDLVYDEKGFFSQSAMDDVNEMYKVNIEMLDFAIGYFMENDESIIEIIAEKENYLDMVEEKARRKHFKRMANTECSEAIASSVYVDMLSNLERMGDHTNNIIKVLTEPTPQHAIVDTASEIN